MTMVFYKLRYRIPLQSLQYQRLTKNDRPELPQSIYNTLLWGYQLEYRRKRSLHNRASMSSVSRGIYKHRHQSRIVVCQLQKTNSTLLIKTRSAWDPPWKKTQRTFLPTKNWRCQHRPILRLTSQTRANHFHSIPSPRSLPRVRYWLSHKQINFLWGECIRYHKHSTDRSSVECWRCRLIQSSLPPPRRCFFLSLKPNSTWTLDLSRDKNWFCGFQYFALQASSMNYVPTIQVVGPALFVYTEDTVLYQSYYARTLKMDLFTVLKSAISIRLMNMVMW